MTTTMFDEDTRYASWYGLVQPMLKQLGLDGVCLAPDKQRVAATEVLRAVDALDGREDRSPHDAGYAERMHLGVQSNHITLHIPGCAKGGGGGVMLVVERLEDRVRLTILPGVGKDGVVPVVDGMIDPTMCEIRTRSASDSAENRTASLLVEAKPSASPTLMVDIAHPADVDCAATVTFDIEACAEEGGALYVGTDGNGRGVWDYEVCTSRRSLSDVGVYLMPDTPIIVAAEEGVPDGK